MLVLLVFSHVANFRYVANFRFLTLYMGKASEPIVFVISAFHHITSFSYLKVKLGTFFDNFKYFI